MKETIIINLIGGPSSGKSTQAALLYGYLKKNGISCELIQEKVRDYIYEDNQVAAADNLRLFSETLYKMKCLNGKVDVIVNDGSLLNNCVYDRTRNMLMHSLIIQEYFKFRNADFFLIRKEFIEEAGRIHNEEESIILDEKIKNVYAFAGAKFHEIPSENAAESIINYITGLGEDNAS